MIRFALAATLIALASTPASLMAQASPTADAAAAPKDDLVPVAIDTSEGRILLALNRGKAPITTANFLKYVDLHRFDGQTFYRAMPASDGTPALIQGGVTTDARKLLPAIKHEPTSETGLKNVTGAISMANAGAGTARSDFFILLSDQPGFDAGGPGGDATGFAVFGQVTEGMDVVRKIYERPKSPTKGQGVMKGQMLEAPVKIIKATRVK